MTDDIIKSMVVAYLKHIESHLLEKDNFTVYQVRLVGDYVRFDTARNYDMNICSVYKIPLLDLLAFIWQSSNGNNKQ